MVSYFAAAIALGAVPRNANYQPYEGDDAVEIFVRSNGVHTDLVFPITTPQFDWQIQSVYQVFRPLDAKFTHISIGWGDRGLYLNTPTWWDLTPRTAFVAIFGLGRSLMHVEVLTKPEPTMQVVRLRISPNQYLRLIDYALAGFDPTNTAALAGYTPTDTFFSANGTYHMFNSCNEWTRRGLSEIGVRTPVWSPFDIFLMWQLAQVAN
jgi:uncharacterized protein (TIGR02117 family)